MRRHTSGLKVLVLASVITLVGLSACSSDSSKTTSTTASHPVETTAASAADTTPDTSPNGTVDDSNSPDLTAPPIDGQGICDLVTADTVGTALGITIDHVVASTADTPQCAYVFKDSTGANDNVTVAVERPEEDMAGNSGDAGFDYVARVNRTISAGGDTTETQVDAGDKAVLFAGSSLSLAVIKVAGRIVAIVIPPSTGATSAEKSTPLVVAVADAFANA
ncbi:MAG: hypothetical protein JWL72_3547 [Ilumatobacteraceae bacterium]|nr:hypothetical protein [Ilumatobacteraceae bacterium]